MEITECVCWVDGRGKSCSSKVVRHTLPLRGFQFVAGSERREKTAMGADESCSVVTSNQIRLVGKEVEHCVQAWDDSTPSFVNGYLGSHVQFFKIHRLLMLRVQSSKL